MKKVIFIISVIAIFIAACSCPANGQTPSPGDAKSYMTAEQLAKYEADIQIEQLEKKLETYGEWVGVGGEVGDAVKEGLMAVVDVADHAGNTNVGKFTMYLIAWKVIGKDLVRIVLGLMFFFFITWLFLKVYKNTYIPKKICTEKGAGLFAKRQYEVVEPDDDWEGYQAVKIIMLFLYAGAIGITYAIMFG